MSISVTEGSTAHLSCGAKGFPKPSYQWFKVGYGELETGFEKELNFDSLNVEDAGNYFCKVANDSSSVSTNTVNVQVIPSGTLSFFQKGAHFLAQKICFITHID